MRVTGRPAASRSVFNSRDYSNLVVTVPAPASAPVLSASLLYGGANHVDGSTYEFAVTYAGASGETLLGPSVSTTCANGQTQGVLPRAARGTRAVGAWIYCRKDGGSWRRTQVAPDGFAKIVGFGDDSVYGGVLCSYNPAGATPPVASTAVDQDGTVIADPVLAPTVTLQAGMPNGTTFYAAYSYVGQDGTETALSPASNAVTIGGRGHVGYAVLPKDPPSGAVFVNLYLSTDGTTWHRQLANQPISYVYHAFQSYDAAGAAPSPSTPQSTLSGLQQAWDAGIEAGGGTVELNVVGATYDVTVPPYLRGRNAAGASVQGMALICNGGHSIDNIARGRVRYVGTLAGVEGIVSSVTAGRVEGLDVQDPNSRVKTALALTDFTGGGSFNVSWKHCTFEAKQAGSAGLAVRSQNQSPSTHAASEQSFERCIFSGNAWGVDLFGTQTLNFRFRDCQGSSGGNGASANSGDFRVWAAPVFNDGWTSACEGQYGFFVSDVGGGKANLDLAHLYLEAKQATQIIYLSARANNAPDLMIRDLGYCINQTGHPIALFYAGAQSGNVVTLQNNWRLDGNAIFGGPGRLVGLGPSQPTGAGLSGALVHPTAGYVPLSLGSLVPAAVGAAATDPATTMALVNAMAAALKGVGVVRT